MSKWRPIETAPKDGTRFLAYWKAPGADKPEIVIAKWNPDWGSWFGVNVQALDGTSSMSALADDWNDKVFVTHWAPLLEPPR